MAVEISESVDTPILGWRNCPYCYGTGKIDFKQICERCEGTGRIRRLTREQLEKIAEIIRKA